MQKPCSQIYVELSQMKNICPKEGMDWLSLRRLSVVFDA